MVCVVRVVGGPFYSLRGQFLPSPCIETCQTAIGRIRSSFLPKISVRAFHMGSADPPLPTSSHRPYLVHCLVGPDVRWPVSGLGSSVWSGLWASFPHVTQDTIVCDFCLRIHRAFFLFRTCAPEIIDLRKQLWS